MSTQLVIEGVQPPPPPKRTPELELQAVVDYITRNKLWSDTPAEQVAQQIVEELRTGMDGYELAKELESSQWWEICTQDVEDLDGVESAIRDALRQARKQWALEWNIQPPLANGTRVKFIHGTGVVAGVSEYDGAVYRIKKDGCTMEGRFSLVNFEDATAVEGGAA